ncbi:MAG TPA: hypothetical protein VGR51_08500, partial [Thermoplasmata archaeon]|nr:hypothetical protein [Thermoplasmata archaeon]
KDIRIAEAAVTPRIESRRRMKDRPKLRWGQIQKAKKAKLAEWAEAYGIDASGTRTDLRDRLLRYIDEHRDDEEGVTAEAVEVESPPAAGEPVAEPVEEAPPTVEPSPEPGTTPEPAPQPEPTSESERTSEEELHIDWRSTPEPAREPEPEIPATPEPRREPEPEREPEPAPVSELLAAETMAPAMEPTTAQPPKEEPVPVPAAPRVVMGVARALPCPNCGKDLAYLAQYDRLYCFSCGRYAPKKYGKPEEAEVAKPIEAPPPEVRAEPVVVVTPKIEPPRPVEAPKLAEAPRPVEAKPSHPCPTCGSELRYVQSYERWWCDAEQKYAPKEYGRAKNVCPTCGKDLTWIADYGRWYCYAEGRYAPKTMTAPVAATVMARAPTAPFAAPIARAQPMVVQAPAVSEDRVLALEGVKHVHGGAGAGVGLAVAGLILVLVPILLMDLLPVLGTAVINVDPTTPDGIQNLIMLTVARDFGIILAIVGIVAGLVGLRRRTTP